MIETKTTSSSHPGAAPAVQPAGEGARPDPWQTTHLSISLQEGGEHFAFCTSARTGPDHKFRLWFTLPPGKRGPNEHAHLDESETIELVSGTCRFWVDGVQTDLQPGDVLVIPPGARHRMYNPGKIPALMRGTYDGTAMEDVFVPPAVARASGASLFSVLARMIVYVADNKPTRPSSRLEVRIFRVLAWVLKRFGVKAHEPVLGWDQPRTTASALR